MRDEGTRRQEGERRENNGGEKCAWTETQVAAGFIEGQLIRTAPMTISVYKVAVL